MTATSVITEHLLKSLKGIRAKRILDVGCGTGSLSKTLDDAGFIITGIEPNPKCIEQARLLVPQGTFITTGAQSIPLEDDAFDAIVLVNSFHHIPQNLLSMALQEFNRLLSPNGELIIIEPLTFGSFFETMRPVEDETDIRNHALDVLQQAVDGKMWQLITHIELDRISSFTSSDAFIDMLVSVDPERRISADKNRDQIEKLFSENAMEQSGTFTLTQPHTIWRIKPVK